MSASLTLCRSWSFWACCDYWRHK